MSVWNLLGVHLELGLEETRLPSTLTNNTTMKNTHATKNLSDAGQLLEEMNRQITYALIDALDMAMTPSARAIILNTYLANAREILQVAHTFLDTEIALLEKYSRQITECETPIKQYNIEFTTAVERNNYTLSQMLAQKIATLRACIAEQTVYYKAHLLYKNNILTAQATLQRKVDYLVLNEEKIIQYYDMLKPQLLEELYIISKVLEVHYNE
ncbi:MAG: hypothetical protein LBP53_05245 [Candidatus Peribacteria bacterium]|nr:hypothetical protein [Candidatus Peribacteria bacterium]